MDASFVILWAVVGAVIGWLATQIMANGSLGGLNDILIGVLGAVLGGWIFPTILPTFFYQAFQQSPLLGHIVNAAVGAVIGTFLVRQVLANSFGLLWVLVGAVVWMAIQYVTKGDPGSHYILSGIAGGVLGGLILPYIFGVLGEKDAPLLGQVINSAGGALITTLAAKLIFTV